MDALKRQVGGEHYKKLEMQPAEFIKNHFYADFFLGNVLKYLVRDKGKRLEDLEKAYHYIELGYDKHYAEDMEKHVLGMLKSHRFFTQFKNGKKYAQIYAYASLGNKAKAKELLRKFINEGQYSEV